MGGAVTGSISGAAGGALGGGLNYAADCGSSAEGCSWSGLGHAAAGGAVAGAVGGAIVGGVLPLAGSSIARLSPELDQNSAAGRFACNVIGAAAGAVAPHSFVSTTPVLMADGSTKPISQIKIGDKIANSVPGQAATQTNTVTDVIVTKTDHDFVNLDIQPLVSDATATKTSTPERSTVKSVLKKAAVGLAAALTVVGTTAATGHATQATSNNRSAATTTNVTQHGGTLTTTFHHPFYDVTQAAFVDAQNLKSGDELQTPTGYAVVTSVRLYHADTVTYDLTIGALHTYYVVAGSTPVLVHNVNADECGPTSLYHYTTESKMNQILDSNELWASTKAAKPQDAKLGDGQYLSDIEPGTKTQGQLARAFYGTPWGGQNFTHFIKIDVRGLPLVTAPDRPGVFLIPNDGPLDLTDRIQGFGTNQ